MAWSRKYMTTPSFFISNIFKKFYLRIIGKKRCRSANETRNDEDEDALNENDNNYNTNVTNFEEIAVSKYYRFINCCCS